MEHGVSAPRVGFVPFPYNLPMGKPHDREEHRRIALAALALLYELEQPGEVNISGSRHFAWASRGQPVAEPPC
jgi:D-proline reductase (dithiol) PrdB